MKRQASLFVMENTILRQGKRCFRRKYYLYKTRDGNCLPEDLYPCEAIVTNLVLTQIERKGDWVKVSGTYDVMVWFRYRQGKLIGQSELKNIKFLAPIPLWQIDSNFLYGAKARLCVQNLSLKVIKVIVEGRKKHSCSRCSNRIKVVIEQELLAFEYAPNPLPRPLLALLKNLRCLENFPGKELEPATNGSSLEKQKEEKNARPTSPALLKGKVINKDGEPLERAKIKVQAGPNLYLVRTNREGNYFLPLYPDSYELTVGKKGYISRNLKLKLGSGEIKLMNFELEKAPRKKGFRLLF